MSTSSSEKQGYGILKRIHPMSGGLAMILIATFFIASVAAEVIGDPAMIAAVKRAILYGIGVLIPATMIAGVSGFRMAYGSPPALAAVANKSKRMKLIAANGLVILIPAAITLDHFAQAGDFGPVFVAVQVVELAVGAFNLMLMGLNMRDGFALRRKRRTRAMI